MKTLIISFFFLLVSSVQSYSQYIINEDRLNAEIYVRQNILVSNTDSDITLSGEFVVIGNTHSVIMTPQNAFSILIIPVVSSDNKGEPENKVAIEDDDKPRKRFINIHPNPADNNLIIDADTVINTVEIYTIYGEKKLSQSTSGIHKELNLRLLNNGLYIIKVYLKNGDIINRMLTKQ